MAPTGPDLRGWIQAFKLYELLASRSVSMWLVLSLCARCWCELYCNCSCVCYAYISRAFFVFIDMNLDELKIRHPLNLIRCHLIHRLIWKHRCALLFDFFFHLNFFIVVRDIFRAKDFLLFIPRFSLGLWNLDLDLVSHIYDSKLNQRQHLAKVNFASECMDPCRRLQCLSLEESKLRLASFLFSNQSTNIRTLDIYLYQIKGLFSLLPCSSICAK